MHPASLSDAGEDGVAVLTLGAGGGASGLGVDELLALAPVLDGVLRDPAVGALLVVGEARTAFEGRGLGASSCGPAAAAERALDVQAVLSRFDRGGKPTLAAVQGEASGLGLDVALACHLRVLGADATLSLAAGGERSLPGHGGLQRLARAVGGARALEVALTGRILDAATALAWGLATAVVPPDALRASARDCLARVLEGGALRARLVLEAVTYGAELAAEDAGALEASLLGLAVAADAGASDPESASGPAEPPS